MLRRNIDLNRGLVNRAIGSVTIIIFQNENSEIVRSVLVKFDNITTMGSFLVEPGMAYIALSRCRKFENVYLIDFDISKFTCNIQYINEYNSLKSILMPNAGTIISFNSLLEEINQHKVPTDLKRPLISSDEFRLNSFISHNLDAL